MLGRRTVHLPRTSVIEQWYSFVITTPFVMEHALFLWYLSGSSFVNGETPFRGTSALRRLAARGPPACRWGRQTLNISLGEILLDLPEVAESVTLFWVHTIDY